MASSRSTPSTVTPVWLRALGARIGRTSRPPRCSSSRGSPMSAEAPFWVMTPSSRPRRLGGGWLRVADTRSVAGCLRRQFGHGSPGRKVPKRGLVAVLRRSLAHQARPARVAGPPPQRLRRGSAGHRRHPDDRAPACGLRAPSSSCARAVPVWLCPRPSSSPPRPRWLWLRSGWLAVLLGGSVVVVGAVGQPWRPVPSGSSSAKVRPGNHPLWSSFIWRNELADAFTEVIAALVSREPSRHARPQCVVPTLGAKVGHGVWCDTYWLPEPDLIDLRTAPPSTPGASCRPTSSMTASVDGHRDDRRGWHPRTELGRPAGSRIGRPAVGPVSLVMRGESVPDRTRWMENPVGHWLDEPGPAAYPRP